jgi:hypothetical protein
MHLLIAGCSSYRQVCNPRFNDTHDLIVSLERFAIASTISAKKS